jgi:nonsense-mediated mRNA decay protein 3
VSTCNFNRDEKDDVPMPDVILVRKHFLRNEKAERNWKLKSITREAPDAPGLGMGVKPGTDSKDMEMFMRDLEEDTEMRGKVNVFKRNLPLANRVFIQEEGVPEIPLEEMMDDLNINDKQEEEEVDDDEDEDDL